MEYANTFVFQELNIANQILFLWYKLADEQDERYIVPHKLLTAEQHLAALAYE